MSGRNVRPAKDAAAVRGAMNTSDTFKLPGGRVITRRRAVAIGLIDEAGNHLKVIPDSTAARVLQREERAKAWTERQAQGGRRRRLPGATEGPATTEDGKMRVKREPKPLKPQNVTPEGEPITDEETLAEIAAKTEAIEAAKAAAEAAEEA